MFVPRLLQSLRSWGVLLANFADQSFGDSGHGDVQNCLTALYRSCGAAFLGAGRDEGSSVALRVGGIPFYRTLGFSCRLPSFAGFCSLFFCKLTTPGTRAAFAIPTIWAPRFSWCVWHRWLAEFLFFSLSAPELWGTNAESAAHACFSVPVLNAVRFCWTVRRPVLVAAPTWVDAWSIGTGEDRVRWGPSCRGGLAGRPSVCAPLAVHPF